MDVGEKPRATDTKVPGRISHSHFTYSPYAAGGYFGQYKVMQKTLKMTETLANGYSFESTQRKLSNKYQHDRV